MPLRRCLCCGHEYRGNYCPNCGQSASTGRLSFHAALVQVAASLTNLESGFVRSCVELFYRPGYMIRDYLYGKRTGYQKPFSMLFVLATIHVVVHYLCYQNGGVQVNQGMSADGIESVTLLHLLQMLNAVINYLLSNQAILTLVFILFLTLPNWLVYKLTTYGRMLNVAEHFYVMLFIGCQLLIFNIVEMPFIYFNHGEEQVVSFFSGYSCLLAIWDFKQLYRISLSRSVLLFMLASLLALILFITFLIISAVFYFYFIHPELRTLLLKS